MLSNWSFCNWTDLALSATRFIILVKWLKLPKPQFPPVEKWDIRLGCYGERRRWRRGRSGEGRGRENDHLFLYILPGTQLLFKIQPYAPGPFAVATFKMAVSTLNAGMHTPVQFPLTQRISGLYGQWNKRWMHLMRCYGSFLKCVPWAPYTEDFFLTCSAIGWWRNFQEVGPGRRKLGHRQCAQNIRIPLLFPGKNEANSNTHVTGVLSTTEKLCSAISLFTVFSSAWALKQQGQVTMD